MFLQLTPYWFVPECFSKFCDKLAEQEKPVHEPALENVDKCNYLHLFVLFQHSLYGVLVGFK